MFTHKTPLHANQTIMSFESTEPRKTLENVIYKTSDYSWFKKVESNRVVNLTSKKRKELEEYIKSSGLLNPILVNSDGYVIDGQHRLAICEKNDIPVIYFVNPNVTKEDIAKLNALPDNWKTADYVHSHATTNQTYAKLIELQNRYGVTEAAIAGLLSGELNNKTNRDSSFKCGQLEVADKAWGIVTNFLDFLLDFQGNNKLPIKYIFALFKVWTLSSIDKKRLLHVSSKIQDKWDNTSSNRYKIEAAIFDCYNSSLPNHSKIPTCQETYGTKERIFIIGDKGKSQYESLGIYNFYAMNA